MENEDKSDQRFYCTHSYMDRRRHYHRGKIFTAFFDESGQYIKGTLKEFRFTNHGGEPITNDEDEPSIQELFSK